MTKNISLSDEAYELLKNIKGKNESFSEVIKRIVGEKGNLLEILDLYPELKEEKEFEENVEAVRKEFNKRSKRLVNEMS